MATQYKTRRNVHSVEMPSAPTPQP